MKALLFDLDGTLLDTIRDLASAVNHTEKAYGYPTHSVDDVCRMVGNGIRSLMVAATPGGEANPQFEDIMAEFRTYYGAHKLDTTAPYEGIPEMLAALKAAGYPIAIVSNKIDSAVRGLADMFFPEIAVAIGEREGIPRKPAPDLVHLAMRELGAEDAYFIGDSEVDIATAKNAGLRCLSVTWGFRSEETLRAAGGEHFFATPRLLTEYLLGEAK